MKNKLIAILILFFLSSCFLIELREHQKIYFTKDVNYCHQNNYTGLDTLINITGYYTQYEKNRENNIRNFIFFANGLILQEQPSQNFKLKLKEEKGMYYGDWGTYKIKNDTVKMRYLPFGYGDVYGEYWYRIIDKTQLSYIGYVHEGNTISRLQSNWSTATFTPLDTLPDPNKSWIIDNKWFWCDEEKYKQWKEENK
jgi:hypothetical protein